MTAVQRSNRESATFHTQWGGGNGLAGHTGTGPDLRYGSLAIMIINIITISLTVDQNQSTDVKSFIRLKISV